MRFGVCCSLENAPIALRAGADYVELPAWPLASDPAYLEALRGLPVEATNLFLPSGITLRENHEACRAHGKAVVEKAEQLRIDVVVIGSGGARRFPDEEKIPGYLTFVESVEAWNAAATKVRLAPESLNRDETNIGCDLNELATMLHERGVGYTADSYHVLKEWHAEGGTEPFDELWEYQVPVAPAHVHISDLQRRAPAPKDPAIVAFFRRLKELGYDARMSFECRWDDFEIDIEPALNSVKAMWESA